MQKWACSQGSTCAPVSPAKFASSLHSSIVINFNVIKITVSVVLQVEGFKHQLDQVPWTDSDVPGAVGTVGVDGGVARTCDGARGAGQSITAA